MKKIIFSSIFALAFAIANAQSYIYHPFPDSDAVWRVDYYDYSNPNCQWGPCAQYYYTLGKDTLIGSYLYKSVIPRGSGGLGGFIRQDISMKKVYVRVSDSTEKLLYDFTLNKGDTLQPNNINVWSLDTIVVNSVDSVLINGQYRKRWVLSPPIFNDTTMLIEGIGSNRGLFESIIKSGFEEWAELVCFEQNGKKIFPDTLGDTCQLLMGIPMAKRQEENNGVKIYPNPINQNAIVEFENLKKESAYIQIFNFLGQEVYRIFTVNNKVVLNNEDYRKGVYLIKLSLGDSIAYARFIVN